MLIEPLAGRGWTGWTRNSGDLALDVTVERGRAEEPAVLHDDGRARTWSPPGRRAARRLAGLPALLRRRCWCSRVPPRQDEITRDAAVVRTLGGGEARIHRCRNRRTPDHGGEIPRIGVPAVEGGRERR
ncbi:hypothetical protein HBB16_07900 [Pseudonocardia sp. MCCB 268]|nr:hypothetical protein [Pseudonocardia cytotoxica]